MLDNKGDTIVYQLYAWVRLLNLFRKTDKNIEVVKETKYSINKENDKEYNSERQLALHLTEFDEMVKRAGENLLPNYLCEYLYTMSIKISEFWRDCYVVNNANELTRLKLCLASKIIMEKCFNILKIPSREIERL